MEFTEEEVQEKLKELGYVNVPKHKLQEFMFDLQELIDHESTTNTTNASRYSTETEEESPGSDIYSRKPLQQSNGRRTAFSREKISSGNYRINDDKENSTFQDRSSESLSSTLVSTCPENESKMMMNASCRSNGEVRRKVARKRDGQTRVFDETFSETESHIADITAMEERLRSLPISERGGLTMATRHNVDRNRPASASSARSRPSIGEETTASLPAFIRTTDSHPHTRGLRKTDPVARYHKFKEEWKQNKIPGESKHSTLRWQVRGQMLNYEMFEKPRHRHVTNDYVVPTDKKRQALRWEVRSSMARM